MENSHPLVFYRLHNSAKFVAHWDIYRLNSETWKKEILTSLLRIFIESIPMKQCDEESRSQNSILAFSGTRGCDQKRKFLYFAGTRFPNLLNKNLG